MGLNDIPAATIAAEKRRRLIGALEKCDEDLQTLKKLIEVVKCVGDRGDKIQVYYRGRDELEAARPVSVLDEFTRSGFCSYSKRHNTNIGKIFFFFLSLTNFIFIWHPEESKEINCFCLLF